MNKHAATLLLLLLPVLLTGCWDLKDISDFNLVTALGVDYKDGTFTAYAELIDYSSVGNQRKGRSTEEHKHSTWIGKGTGPTVAQAMASINRSSQQRLVWDHVTTILLSEEVIRTLRLQNVLDGINRFREIRYTPWVFTTRQPVERVLAYPRFVNMSPIGILSHDPGSSRMHTSPVQPVQLLELAVEAGETTKTEVVPSLRLDDSSWKSEKESETVVRTDGGFPVHDGTAGEWMSDKDLEGYRWKKKDNRPVPLVLTEGKEQLAVLRVFPSGWNVKVEFNGDKPSYTIRLKLRGYVSELSKEIGGEKLKLQAAEEVRRQVVDTFAAGASRGLDLYGLEENLYRRYNKKWKVLHSNGGNLVDRSSLKDVQVTMELTHPGKYRLDSPN